MRKDDVCCYSLAYFFTAARYYISAIALKIGEHPAFDIISLLVVVANSITLATIDPTLDERPHWYVVTDYVFQGIYTAELVIKVLGLGFIFNQGAYMRDPWNVFNFIIILIDYLALLDLGGGLDLETLRMFRVLRPLRLVSKLEGLRILMNALASAILPLIGALLILLFFTLVFAIIGLQLWHGILKRRCFDVETGELSDRHCGSYSCPDNMVCVEGFDNPNFGITSFDNIFSALLTVFQCVTMEGWTTLQLNVVRRYGAAYVIYFTLLILLGSFFLINFTLAVIKTQVSKLYSKAVAKKKTEKSAPNSNTGKSIDTLLSRVKGNDQDIRAERVANFMGQQTMLGGLPYTKTGAKEHYARLMGFERPETNPVAGGVKRGPTNEMRSKGAKNAIEEEDESLLSISRDISFNDGFKNPNGKYVKIADLPSSPMRSSGKKLESAGMIGIRSYINPSLQASFNLAKSLDEFTEEFFKRQQPFREVRQANEEEMQLPAIEEGAEQPRDETILPLRPLNSGDEHKLAVPQFATMAGPSDPVKDVSPEKESVKNGGEAGSQISENLGILRSEERSRSLDSSLGEENNQQQNINDQKFIFRDQVIETPSAGDVIYDDEDSSFRGVRKIDAVAVLVRPPYKMKVVYMPTLLPKEDDDKPVKSQSEKGKSRRNMQSDLGSVSRVGSSQHESVSKKSSKVSKLRTRKREGEKQSRVSAGSRRKGGSMTGSRNESTISKAQSNTSMAETEVVAVNKDPEEKQLPVIEQIKKDTTEESKALKRQFLWSGQEVLSKREPYFGVYQTTYINEIRVWSHSYKGSMSKLRYSFKRIAKSTALDVAMNILILVNTVLLALDRYGQSKQEKDILTIVNIVISSIFVAELVVKLAGLGIVKYFSDSMNYLDFIVVVCSMVEILFIDSSGVLSSLKSLKAFRVLRIARLLRRLRSIQTILEVIGKTIGSFAYIGLLLIIFIFIYALFGMQLYGGKFTFAGETQEQNFDSFHNAFLSLFQVLTLENWQDIIYSCIRARAAPIAAIYVISWIYLGNYVLLNLFLAIMLDAFTEVDKEITEEIGESDVTACMTVGER